MIDYGSFAKLFDDQQLYLKLLHLEEPESRRALEAVKEAAGQSPGIKDELTALFSAPTWREHLVAAAALSFVKVSPAVIAAAWDALDKEGYVNSQLAATLSFYDKSFKHQAIKRLIIGCLQTKPIPGARVCRAGHDYSPILVVMLPSASLQPDIKSEAGPESIPRPAGSAISAVAALLADCPDPEVQILLQRPEVQALAGVKSGHIDNAGTKWLADLQRMVKEMI